MHKTKCLRCETEIEYKTCIPKWCKECAPIIKIETTRKWQKNNPEKVKINKREYEVPDEKIVLIAALMALTKQIKALGDKL